MLNPEPIQLKWQKVVLGPVILVAIALVAVGAFWLQQAQPAGAEPETFVRYYQGDATVKVKNGNAYATYPVKTCTFVETMGENGNIVDVGIFGINANQEIEGSDTLEFFCGEMFCICGDDPQSAIEEQNGIPELLPGMFYIDTYLDQAETGGFGWQTNPLKQTSTQWKFTLKKVLMEAGFIALNNDFRPLQANTTLVVKFIRGREGLYWKVAGSAPLNDNGTPKVTVEIETPGTGHDAPPRAISATPEENEVVNSDTSMTVDFSEPVNVDPEGVSLYCFDAGEYFDVTISGQGTSTIVVDPVLNLPFGDSCEFHIDGEAISDVDNVDPPDVSIEDVWIQFEVAGQGCLCNLNGSNDNLLDI